MQRFDDISVDGPEDRAGGSSKERMRGERGVFAWPAKLLGEDDPVWGNHAVEDLVRGKASLWRTQLLELALLLLTITIVITSIVLINFAAEEAARKFAYRTIPLSLLSGLALAWRGAPQFLRVSVLIGIYWFGIAAGTTLRGYALPNPFIAGMVVCILSALILNSKRAGQVVFATILLIAASAVPWLMGRSIASDGFADPSDPSNWIRVVVMFAFLAVFCTAAVLFLVNKLEASSEAAADFAEKMDAARSTAEAAKMEADRANRAKSHFLAAMSHDLRTPLTAIIGVSEILSGQDIKPGNDIHLSVLSKASHAMLTLIDDTLDLSSLDSGQVLLERESFDLHALVEEVVTIARIEAERRSLSVSCESIGPSWVVGDSRRIRQILFNLVENAIKYTVEGGVRVSSTTRSVIGWSRSNCGRQLRVTLTVSDSGIGISDEERERVFEPYQRAGDIETRAADGSGLGLAITRELVKLMDGTIAVESSEGDGSTFTVNLSLPKGEPPPERAALESEGAILEKLTPAVMVVEDNPTTRTVIDLMLTSVGCEVTLVTDGMEAVSTLNDSWVDYSLVFMDCLMPRMNGFEATRALRAAGIAVPIVAMTANATHEDHAECLAAGMDDFITKPVSLDTLRSVLIRNLQTPAS